MLPVDIPPEAQLLPLNSNESLLDRFFRYLLAKGSIATPPGVKLGAPRSDWESSLSPEGREYLGDAPFGPRNLGITAFAKRGIPEEIARATKTQRLARQNFAFKEEEQTYNEAGAEYQKIKWQNLADIFNNPKLAEKFSIDDLQNFLERLGDITYEAHPLNTPNGPIIDNLKKVYQAYPEVFNKIDNFRKGDPVNAITKPTLDKLLDRNPITTILAHLPSDTPEEALTAIGESKAIPTTPPNQWRHKLYPPRLNSLDDLKSFIVNKFNSNRYLEESPE